MVNIRNDKLVVNWYLSTKREKNKKCESMLFSFFHI